MRQFLNFIAIALMLQFCNQVPERDQPVVLEKNCQFDLEKINFQEDLSKLYSKHLLIDGFQYDSVRDGKLTDEMLRYSINNLITDMHKLKAPEQDFGFVFRSPTIDSIALFQNIYFKKLNALTDNNKKPVAFYTEAELKTEKEQKDFLLAMKNKYGTPKHSFFLSSEFNICAYEWVLTDRTLEVQTSYGHRFSSDFNSGAEKKEIYYRIDMLIIDNHHKENIYKAHLFEFSDKIVFRDKYHSYKDFQYEKISIFHDEFLLQSTNEALVKEEHGLYDISRSDNETSRKNLVNEADESNATDSYEDE